MASGETLLDALMPEWDQQERHERHVAAPPRRALDLALAIETGDVKGSAVLMGLRYAPGAIAGGRSPRLPHRRLVEAVEDLGLVELGRRDEEIVYGAAGRFWRMREELDPVETAEEFRAYDRPGAAKMAINLLATDADGGSILSTETRVSPTDRPAQRRMRLYWGAIRAPGALMRREWLAATARAALE